MPVNPILTDPLARTWQAIRDQVLATNQPTTIREVAAAARLNRGTVGRHARLLEEDGFVRLDRVFVGRGLPQVMISLAPPWDDAA